MSISQIQTIGHQLSNYDFRLNPTNEIYCSPSAISVQECSFKLFQAKNAAHFFSPKHLRKMNQCLIFHQIFSY